MFISISSHKWNTGLQSFPFHLISASKWKKLKSTRGGWVLMGISCCVAHYLFLSAQKIVFPINISTSRRMWWEARGPARIQTCCHKLVSYWSCPEAWPSYEYHLTQARRQEESRTPSGVPVRLDQIVWGTEMEGKPGCHPSIWTAEMKPGICLLLLVISGNNVTHLHIFIHVDSEKQQSQTVETTSDA